MTIKIAIKRLTAILLTVLMLAASFPLSVLPASSEVYDRVADPSTMDGWKQYFGKDVPSTQNVGGVWTDKSVFADDNDFRGTGITLSNEDDGFLVALSAIASDTAIKGLTNLPADVMLVLELSDSVYAGDIRDPATVSDMLAAVDRTVDELQALNPYNRVGIVVYSGEQDHRTSADSAAVLLPLGRYTYTGGDEDYSYVKPTVSDGKLVSVDVNADVIDESGKAVTGRYILSDATGAYVQHGMLKALDEWMAADPKLPATAKHFAGQTRVPVMVLLSANEPTAATVDYTSQNPADLSNTADLRHPAQTDFLTQLTASYVRTMLDAHYEQTDPLMYTVSLGGDVSRDVTDPYGNDKACAAVLQNPASHTAQQLQAAAVNRTIDSYWELLVNDGYVDITVQAETYTVSQATAEINGQSTAFPNDKTQKYYVEDAFTCADAAGLAQAFASVFDQIKQRSRYFPTLVEGDEELSGYVSVTDRIGEHMSITDIKGILIDNVLFSGALLSRNFVTGGGELGSFDAPTSLGDELVWAVKARLGIDTDTARDLLGLAYDHGQLSYTSDTDFSNYIGWYANAAGEFLGFWYDGTATMPDPSDPSLTDATRPAYIVRSYGFLGAVDEAHGVTESDLMYATVQIREHITTGVEELLFSVPAALIPTVTYEIALDENNAIESFAVSGAEHPIRLVYEVALDDEINALTVAQLTANGYAHQNSDGTVDFYTNAFEADGSVGYGKSNTHSSFTPSRQNARYYYTEDSPLYTDTDGTLYSGDKPASDAVLYRAFTVYGYADGPIASVAYERVSPVSLERALRHPDGHWYIPAGTVRTMLEQYVTKKTDNATASLPYANVPFVDTVYSDHVGATLGNNGRLTLRPETGILLQMGATEESANARFTLTLTRTDAAQTASYDAILYAADGSTSSQTVAFERGVAQVSLAQGEALYIIGMTAGACYTVYEEEHAEYKLAAINGDATLRQAVLTLEEGAFAKATFENAPKGYGDVTIVKRVTHDFGASYEIPDKSFTLLVDLPDTYADTTVRAAHSEDPTLTEVLTDENGSFTVTMKHTDQFELFALKEGTVVTVTEIDIPAGFTPIYYGAGIEGVPSVTVRENEAISIIVANAYAYSEVEEVNITVGGTKHLLGRENDEWLETDIYAFELQRYTDGKWETVARETVNDAHRRFDFSDAMKAQRFSTSGVYSYQVVEISCDLEGVVYDRTVHTFTVTVGDPDMCGHLRILDVTAHHENEIVSGNAQSGWTVTTDFTNLYLPKDHAVVSIDITQQLVNPSQSDRVSLSGFGFGLYADGAASPAFVSDYTDMVGEARLIASFDAVGSYTYILKEIVPEDPIAGMVYSTESYTVVIDVTEASDGTLRAAATVFKGEQAIVTAPSFTNSYIPAAASLLPQVNKVLTGRALRDGEFTFRIKMGENVLASGVNTADGTVCFDNSLIFDKVGEYYYDVAEEAGEVAGVSYDTTVYRIHVTVADHGGVLSAHYHVINTVADTITFTNRYEPQPTEIVVSGIKQLIGRELINEEFNFVLVDMNEGGIVLSAFNYADGTFRFEPITLHEVGEYRYAVHEVHRSTTHGIEFDSTMYDVLVTVTDDGNGALHADMRLMKDGVQVDEIVFVNRYTTAPAQLVIDGTARLSGRELAKDDLAFVLYEADAMWEAMALTDTASNDVEGGFAFDTLTFEEAGVYHYLVKAAHSGETVDGVTYDTEVFRVLVVVTDNTRGTLTATKTVLDSSNDYVDAVAFYNTYSEPTTTTTTAASTSVTASTTVTTASDATVTTTALTTAAPTAATSISSISTTTAATQSESPRTGESTDVLLWLLMLLVSGAATTALYAHSKRCKQ